MAIAKITTKGQITIPKEVRVRLGVEPGDGLEFRILGEKVEVLPVRRRRLAEFRGLFRVDRALDIEEERVLARSARVKRAVSDETLNGS